VGKHDVYRAAAVTRVAFRRPRDFRNCGMRGGRGGEGRRGGGKAQLGLRTLDLEGPPGGGATSGDPDVPPLTGTLLLAEGQCHSSNLEPTVHKRCQGAAIVMHMRRTGHQCST